MKKSIVLGLALLISLFNPLPAFANHVDFKPIDAVTINASPTSASGIIYTADMNRVSFLVDYDETDAGAALSVAVTLTCSWDASNYQACGFYDVAGGATIQTSETISADGRYIFWLEPNAISPYTKVVVTATGSDSTHTAVVTVYALGRQ